MYHARIFKIDEAKEKEKNEKKQKEDVAKEDKKKGRRKKQTHGVAMSQSGTSNVRGTSGTFPGRDL